MAPLIRWGKGGSVLPEDAGTGEQKETSDEICQTPDQALSWRSLLFTGGSP